MRCKGQAHLWKVAWFRDGNFGVVSWCFGIFQLGGLWNGVYWTTVAHRLLRFSWGTKWRFCDAGQRVFQTVHFLIHQIEQRKHPSTDFQSWGLNHFVSTWYFLCSKSGTFIFQNFPRDVWDRSQLEMFSLQKDGSFCQLAQNVQIYSWGNQRMIFILISSQPNKNEENVVCRLKRCQRDQKLIRPFP